VVKPLWILSILTSKGSSIKDISKDGEWREVGSNAYNCGKRVCNCAYKIKLFFQMMRAPAITLPKSSAVFNVRFRCLQPGVGCSKPHEDN